ncbi:MAG: AMP-binding protein [Rhodospirillaceae bacterium]|nr:AMP-binding protein [Rhodospirillaceae bacterium]
MSAPGNVPSAHVDNLARLMLPPKNLWPDFDYTADHLKDFPDHINAAQTLIDNAIAEGFGGKKAYICDGISWTYDHLLNQSERIAQILVDDFGLVPGNRVLLRSRNNPMLVACWLGVLKAGGICVTTMPLLKADELSFILNRMIIQFAFCEYDLVDDLNKAKLSCPTLKEIECFSPLGLGAEPSATLDRKIEQKMPGFTNVKTAADDIALVTFTSGTTGNPKAAVHFHRDILAACMGWPKIYTIEPEEVICGTPSLAFTYGLGAFLLYPLFYRATAALVPFPTPTNILQAVENCQVTSLYMVPTALNAMFEELDNYDIGSLKKISSAGENLQPALWNKWYQKTGIKIVNGIGTTETLSHFISEPLEVEKVGSAGKPVPGYIVQIIDEKGNPLPQGEPGFIALRGPTGCRYFDDIERQRIFVRNGWNVSGDLFKQDADGLFWFVERADDMIVSSGYNISPQDVEKTVLEHPSVAECAIIGIDDEARGKIVRACVVLNTGYEENDATKKSIQDFVKQTIAPYKYPRDIRFYDSLPRTATGKIQRFHLRDD